jgi:hypothetical protein
MAGPASRDLPLHVQKQSQSQGQQRPAKAGRYKFKSRFKDNLKKTSKNFNNARVKGRRPLQAQSQRQI